MWTDTPLNECQGPNVAAAVLQHQANATIVEQT